MLLGSGRLDEAIAEMRRAQQLDPVSLTINAALGSMFNFARRYDEAITQLQKTLAMDQNFSLARYNLGLAYAHKGLFDEAVAEFQKAKELDPDSTDAVEELGMVRRTNVRARRAGGSPFAGDGEAKEGSRTTSQSYARSERTTWLRVAGKSRRHVVRTLLRFDPQGRVKADPRFKDSAATTLLTSSLFIMRTRLRKDAKA